MSARTLRMDFSRPRSSGRLLGSILLVAGIATGALLYGEYADLQAERARWADRLADTQRLARRALPSLAAEEAPSREVALEIGRANEVLDQLNLGWDRLFGDIESAVTPDVAMLGIQPNPRARSVTIDGEAKDLNGLLTFLARLEGTSSMDRVFLASHEVRTSDPQRPIDFKIQATWTSVR
ncbi:MAG: hypothetical protein GC151_14110 [Betaproteobacteria bacterium]|nr:hypothetical protein [Betaproteobacteria bacterium]